MKEIKLFVDFEFTSLSPDAQPISIGIVSEEIPRLSESDQFHKFALTGDETVLSDSKSFYAEFSDFDINRCDDWVKENVVGKLKGVRNGEFKCYIENGFEPPKSSTVDILIPELKQWLSQFSDYQIQFVVDCGTWDWYHLLQLIGKWEEISNNYCSHCKTEAHRDSYFYSKTGLPKLAYNISPVPLDLNDIIAFKQGISIKEAFDLNREELTGSKALIIDENLIPDGKTIEEISEEYLKTGYCTSMPFQEIYSNTFMELSTKYKHNSLWDAKVMKAIYENLMA
jgi:hypothetical protein